MTTNDKVLVPRCLSRATITAVLHEVLDEYDERLCAGAFDEIVDRLAAAPQPAEPAYDRELIACMLEDGAAGGAEYLLEAIAEQAALLRAADNAIGSGVTVRKPAEDGQFFPVPKEESDEIDAALGLSCITLRLPHDLLHEIEGRAQKAGLVRNAYLRSLLAELHTPGIEIQQRSAAVVVDEAGDGE